MSARVSTKRTQINNDLRMNRAKSQKIFFFALFGLMVIFAGTALWQIDCFNQRITERLDKAGRGEGNANVMVDFRDDVRVTYNQGEVKATDQGLLLEEEGREDVIYVNMIPINGSTFASFTERVETDHDSDVTYQVTTDPKKWYFYNGSEWADGTECDTCSNSAEELNDNIASLPIETDEFRVKAILENNGSKPLLSYVDLEVEGGLEMYSDDQVATRDLFLIRTGYATGTTEPCPCEHGMVSLTVQFVGENGSTINVWYEKDHKGLIQTFTNVQNGDYLSVQSSMIGEDKFKAKTFFETVGSSDVEIHTSCSDEIEGLTFGDYYVVGFQDVDGNICDIDTCRPPNAIDDLAETNVATPVDINVLNNDTDPDGDIDPSSVQVIDGPDHGSVDVDPSTGVVTYTPNPSYSGDDSFEYRVCDVGSGGGGHDDDDDDECDDDDDDEGSCGGSCPSQCDTAIVTITVVSQCGNGVLDAGEQCDPNDDVRSCSENESCVNCQCIPDDGPVPNPPLEEACGLEIALVLDSSDSLNSTELQQVRNAALGFVDSLEDTPTEFGVVDFDTQIINSLPITDDMDAVRAAINGIGHTGVTELTNWEAALIQGQSLFGGDDPTKPNLLVIVTDGDPTTYGYPTAQGSYGGTEPDAEDIDNAIAAANVAKLAGTRILAVGVSSAPTVANLIDISGPTVNAGDLTTDVITAEFNALQEALGNFALEMCGGTITVTKYIDEAVEGNEGGQGWEFDVAGTTRLTDENGQTEPVEVDQGTDYSVIETGPLSDYQFVSATCKDQDDNPVGSSATDGVDGIDITGTDIISCEFINEIAPNPPVAVDDEKSTGPDTPVTIDVPNNDSDPDGDLDLTTVTIITDPDDGTITYIDPITGEVTYDPDPGFGGEDTFEYEICDLTGLCDTAWVTITVNQPPVAENDEETTLVDTPVDVDLLANDSDPDGVLVPATTTVTVDPDHGDVVINGATGEATYTPDPGYYGVDTFEYEVCDDDGLCDEALVTITVLSPPTAEDDEETTLVDTPVDVVVLTNDEDLDGVLVPGTVEVLVQPANGTATVDPITGIIEYDPDPAFFGTNTFEYQVCDDDDLCDTAIVTVTILSPPIAEDDEEVTPCGEPVQIGVLGNDTDYDGVLVPSTVDVTTDPANGTIDVNLVTGVITYTPDPGFCGDTDTFVYEVCDDDGLCDDATVTVVVRYGGIDGFCEDFVNNFSGAPAGLIIGEQYGAEGIHISATANAGRPEEVIIFDSNASDTADPDLEVDIGNLAIIPENITDANDDGVVDDPNDSSQGGTQIYEFDDPKTVISFVFVDMDGGNTGTATAYDENNDEILSVEIPDGGESSIQTIDMNAENTRRLEIEYPGSGGVTEVKINCDDICIPPVATDDFEDTPMDTPVDVDVLINDFDPDGELDPSSVTVTIQPTSGTISGINPTTGVITFQPAPGYFGVVTFEYEVCDNSCELECEILDLEGEEDNDDDDNGGECADLCSSATVTIRVMSPPVAEDDYEDTPMETPVTVDVLDNDSDPDGVLVPNTVTVTSPPSDGSITGIDPLTGEITYLPDPGFYGEDTFDYEVCDDDGLCDEATVTITVLSPPTAEDDTETTQIDTPVPVAVLNNDSDPDGFLIPSTVTITVPAGNGTATPNPVTGIIDYVPAPGYYGQDTFEYEVCDNDGMCDDAKVTITILAPPIAEDDFEVTDENEPVDIDILDNDTDPDGVIVPGTVEVLSGPANGAITNIDPVTGVVTYLPDPGFAGPTDTFTYKVCDNDGLCDTALVTITINENYPPEANNDYEETPMETPVDIDVLVNDSDPDGDLVPSTVTVISPPTNGTVTNIDPITGINTYLPDPGFYGVDTYEYEVCDNDGACDDATVTIVVLAPPTAEDDVDTTLIDTPVDVHVLDNDTDPDGVLVPSTVTVTVDPVNGTITGIDPVTGQVTYLPDSGYFGTDTFEYEVCDDDGFCDDAEVTITILAPPTAEDDTDETEIDVPVVTDILVNDSDLDGVLVPSTVTITVQPVFGTITNINPVTGFVEYTPDPGYYGTDTYTYEVCDDDGLCDDALVTITILAPPVANNDFEVTDENVPVDIDILDNDTDPDGVIVPNTVTVTIDPVNGTITNIDPTTGVVTYLPDPGFAGPTDTFTYEVCDDDGLCDTALVTITINENSPPEANDDFEETPMETPVDIDVLVNDSDPDGNLVPGTVTITVPPSNGTVTNIDPTTGVNTYLPDPGFFGIDTYEYEVCDDDGACDDAVVTITILAPPTAEDDETDTPCGEPVEIGVLDNDSDLDGILLPDTVDGIVDPANGTITIDPVTGIITYTPDPDFCGDTDTFVYEVCDDDGLCDEATVTINVLAPPTAVDDADTTAINTPVVIDILVNDSDIDGFLVPSTTAITTPPVNGTVSVNLVNGEVTYTPNLDFVGVDTFEYQICDNDGFCDIALVTVTIIEGPPPPPPPPPIIPPVPVVPPVVLPALPAPPPPPAPFVIFGANEFILDNQAAPLAQNGVIEFAVNEPQQFYIEAIGATAMSVVNINGSEVFPLVYDADLKLWTGSIFFDEAGFYELEAIASGGIGGGVIYSREINATVAEDRGVIVDVDSGEPVSDAVITVYEKDIDTGVFNEWNAGAFGTTNPFNALENGTFSVVLPRGEYYITVGAPDYREVRSLIVNIDDHSFVTADVSLDSTETFFQALASTVTRGGTDNFPLQVTSVPEHELLVEGEVVPDITVYTDDPDDQTNLFDDIDNIDTVLFLYSTWNTLAAEQLEIYTALKEQRGDQYQIIPLRTLEPDAVLDTHDDRGEYSVDVYNTTEAFHDDYYTISLPHFFVLGEDRVLLGEIVGPQSIDDLVPAIDEIFGSNE